MISLASKLSLLGRVLLLLLLSSLFSGCTSHRLGRMVQDAPIGRGFSIGNIYSADRLPAELRRVALLPVQLDYDDFQGRARFNRILSSQLRRAGRFEVVQIEESELYDVIGRRQILLQESIPIALVHYLKARGLDGVFQLNVDEFVMYRPFTIGVHARLFQLEKQPVLWEVNELFRSTDEGVIISARRYAQENVGNRYPFNDSYASLRGPFLFSEFVIHEVVNTLPLAFGR
tara:strand:- start:1110 stop:1802 length:693 start_codon:yes stop_codon:yes gene_type:complete